MRENQTMEGNTVTFMRSLMEIYKKPINFDEMKYVQSKCDGLERRVWISIFESQRI